MTTPLITVLMPAYNAAEYLNEAIESIINQTFTDFEFLIIDDGSSDNSIDIIKSYNDKRIRLIENGENIKLIATLNKGINLSRGKYIARMDSDDISFPERLQKQFEYMESHPDIGALGTAFISFGENVYSETVYPADDFDIRTGMLYKMQLCHPSAIIRKSVLIDNNIIFSFDFPHAEDYEFFYRVSRVSKLANLTDLLYKRRIHNKQVSKIYSETQKNKTLEIKFIQFQNINVDFNENQIEIFSEINYHHYKKNKEFLLETQNILEQLYDANQKSKVYDVARFSEYLKDLWVNVCTNLSSMGIEVYNIYNKSKLCRKELKNIKLLIKSLIKR